MIRKRDQQQNWQHFFADLAMAGLEIAHLPNTTVSAKIETLEDRIGVLVNAVVEPMTRMAKALGEEFGYETLNGPSPNYEDRHWYWRFVRNGQAIGEIDFSIIIEKSEEGTFTHPLLSFGYHPNVMGRQFMLPVFKEEVPKFVSTDEKRKVAFVVETMLASREHLLQIAYAPLTSRVSQLMYRAFRNSVTEGCKAHLEEQRNRAVGDILAAESMRG